MQSMVFFPPDKTLGTRASAKGQDIKRMQLVQEQSPEERMTKERSESHGTAVMALVAVAGLAVFVFVWWLVVR